MPTTKHTPGPWSIVASGINSFTVQTDRKIAYTFPQYKIEKGNPVPEQATDEDWANAQLIAAAPDLLEALKFMVEVFGPGVDRLGDGCGIGEIDSVKQARAIIAKAEG